MTKKERIKKYLLYLIVFLYVLLLNFKCGFLSDDYHFLFVWKDFMPTGNDKPVENIADIIESAKNYYYLSGGRVIPHFLAFLFTNIDKWVFNFINAGVFVLLGIVTYKYVFGNEKSGIFYQAAVYMSLFLCIPSFGDNALWISGSVNYLWPGTLMLYCIYFCSLNFDSKKTGTNIAMLLLVLLSSSTNEMTGGMLAVWLTAHLIIKRHRIDLKAVLFYILCTAGECFVVLAPGNSNRAANIEKVKIFDLSNIGNIVKVLFEYIENSVLCFNFGLCIIILSAYFLYRRGKIKKCIEVIPLIAAAAAGICALSLTGFYTQRPLFFGIILLISAMWKMIKNLFEENDDQIKKKDVTDIKTNRSGSVMRKAKIFASVAAVIFLAYSMYGYFSLINYADLTVKANYEKYKNGEEITKLSPGRDNLLFPRESFITSTGDYSMEWLKECEKNNLDNPTIRGF